MEGTKKRDGMESMWNSEERYDVGYHPSVSSLDQIDQSTLSDGSYCRTSSEVSVDESSYSETPSPMHWPGLKSPKSPMLSRFAMKQDSPDADDRHDTEDLEDLVELEMMMERFSKLLLGQDMSGCGKGVSTSVAISNAITNLYASIFGHHQKLEPLHDDKKLMWKREMNCLLSVCDFIIEYVPLSTELENAFGVEVMISKPRSDLSINLPALKKLDSMLLDTLESFEETEFWYAEQGSMSENATRSGSFRRIPTPMRTEEKWWLPVPCVPSGGLSERSRRHLQHMRDCANQIHKAAKALNSSILAEMEIPDSYIASLPKSGKAIVGDTIYRYMTNAEKFMPDILLDHLNLSTEHEALELADKVEASMYTWRRKACPNHSKSSWDLMKDLMSDFDRMDKNHVLSERAESLLFSLKQRYPQLSQTSLDASKIQNNKDVGRAILESYSRVLEGLAFNIVAWTDDVLFVDKTMPFQDP